MRNQRKRRKIIKRLISGVSALALSVGLLASIPASADDSTVGYKYTLFAYSSEDDAISSSAANFCVNGNIATNGTISAGQNFNVNGEKKEHANEAMPDLTKAINEKFFAENVDVKAENYKNEDVNINVASPLDVKGKAEFNGNIKLAAGVKAMGDISLAGRVLNNDNTVLFSENGNVVINSENVSLTGLIYAPKGNIVIESKSLNLNSVVMIANKITLNAPNININNSASMAKFVQESIDKNGGSNGNDEPEPEADPAIYAYGEYNEETKSVDIEWYSNVTGEFAVLESLNGTDYTVVSKVSDDTKYSIKVASDFIKKFYKVTTIKDGKTIESIPFSIVNANGTYSTELLDTDKDGLADLYEEMLGTDKTLPDTDKDGLTDYEEVYITNTDPTKYDSVTEGVSDADADNDKDGLNNKREIELKTDPNSDDTDGDTLKDGDEICKYNTDPLKKDTDEDELEDDDEFKFNCDPNKKDTDNNGIIDGKEKHQQTVDVVPDNKEQAVTKVSVSMAATGNVEKTTTIESIMGKDVLCSSVVGLVGEPFSIESESSFDKATITFTVDKTKLGETEFDNLMFLWYDRENDNFVELETSHDAANSTVSIETTHFSEYMIVDSKQWFENWRKIEEERNRLSGNGSSTVHEIIPTETVFFSRCTNKSDPDFLNPDEDSSTVQNYTNYRTLIYEHLVESMSALDTMTMFQIYSFFANPSRSWILNYIDSDSELSKTNLDYYLSYPYTDNDLTEDIEFALKLLAKKDSKNRRIIIIADRDLMVHTTHMIERTQKNADSPNSIDYYSAYKSIPIYFVCIGNFDKTNLESIAEETGGRVYTVATSSDIYKFYSDADSHFDPYLMDSDDDGLTDYEEMAGFYTSNCGKLSTDPQNPDTDGDGIKDGDEFFKKFIKVEASATAGKDIYKCYSILLSDPTKVDTDEDGYYDICDPDRINKPAFIGDKYDFMDNEIYFMKGIHDKYLDVKNASTSAGSIPIMYDKNGDDNQKFRFVWAGTGYSIHPLNNEKLALTLRKNGKEYSVSLEAYTNSGNQRWEVLPYSNRDSLPDMIKPGIVIRSQVLSDPDEDGKQKPLYLSYGEEDVSVSTSLDLNCMFSPESIADWVRFGQLYIYYMGLVSSPNSDVIRALENYQNNKNHNFKDHAVDKDNNDVTNKIPYKNSYLLHRQGLTDFPEMKFGDEPMNKNVCEVIATYNAMTISGETLDFFKLVAEFEINALLVWDSGCWGSDPAKIENCLKAYNENYQRIGTVKYINYTVFSTIAQKIVGNNMYSEYLTNYKGAKAAIISVNYNVFEKHTYTIEYNNDEHNLYAYNKGNKVDKEEGDDFSELLFDSHYIFLAYVILE